MTDFDYGLAKAAIRITSDRSDCVCLWFSPQMTGIRDRMIAAAKQDMWEARREPRGQVFCGERRGKQCDLTIDQLRTWKGLVRVRFERKETAASVLAWAKQNGIVLVDDRGFGMTGSDRAVDAVLVVCAIAGERGDGTIDLVEQGTDLRAVIDIIGGECRGDDPTRVGIDADVQFAPRPAPARTMLLD